MVLQRIKIKKRRIGKATKFCRNEIHQKKAIFAIPEIILFSKISLMNAGLEKISMQKNGAISACLSGKSKAKFNIPKFAVIAKRVFSFLLVLMLILSQTIFVSGFEAHIINVTAKICDYSQTRTIGYWKNHSEIYKHLLPQISGKEVIGTVPEADNILNFSGDASIMRNKLKAQLLGMKFNIYHYHIGDYFIAIIGKTLFDIAADADAILLDPNATQRDLENMKDLLDDLNNLHYIKSCPSGIVINEFLPNPAGNDAALKKNGEWVELYNLGDAEVDLKGWAFYDLHDGHELLITKYNTNTGNTTIEPKGFLTVYRNGNAIFNLNNAFGDAVRLYNNRIDKGELIDTYAYTVDSPEGKSFALVPDGSSNRVDSLPTPGEPNSALGEDLPFGPAIIEAGEDAEVVNTDMAVPIADVQSPAEVLSDNPVLPSSGTAPGNTIDPVISVASEVNSVPIGGTVAEITNNDPISSTNNPQPSIAPLSPETPSLEQTTEQTLNPRHETAVNDAPSDVSALVNNSGAASEIDQAAGVNAQNNSTDINPKQAIGTGGPAAVTAIPTDETNEASSVEAIPANTSSVNNTAIEAPVTGNSAETPVPADDLIVNNINNSISGIEIAPTGENPVEIVPNTVGVDDSQSISGETGLTPAVKPEDILDIVASGGDTSSNDAVNTEAPVVLSRASDIPNNTVPADAPPAILESASVPLTDN